VLVPRHRIENLPVVKAWVTSLLTKRRPKGRATRCRLFPGMNTTQDSTEAESR